jgi:hypothetical protein
MTDPLMPRQGPSRPVLETATAIVLLMVLAALLWLVLAAHWPQVFGLASPEVEVLVILALLTTALILVSVVALLHTRS